MARTRLTVTGTPVGDVELTVVTPVGTRRSDPLPLLLALDGPEYSRRAHLSSMLRAATDDGTHPARPASPCSSRGPATSGMPPTPTTPKR